MLNPIETVQLFESQPELNFASGEIIFQEGDQGQVMYAIVEGEVEMSIHGHFLEVIKQGDVFGQGALVHEDYLRSSTAIAKTDCQLACLDREHFFFVVQQTPMFALEVMRSYSDRHRLLKQLVDSLLTSLGQL